MTPRAAPLPPADRRQALIDATLPLLLAHGRAVTTRQVAESAGVAEGTIFRVFASKDDLIDATLEHALDVEPFLADLRRIEPGQPLRDLARDLVTLLQVRFRGVFGLTAAMGIVGPPQAKQHDSQARWRQILEEMTGLVAPYADELACPPEQLVHVLRLLTFSGTHPHLSQGRVLTTDEIVATVLDGLLRPDGPGRARKEN